LLADDTGVFAPLVCQKHNILKFAGHHLATLPDLSFHTDAFEQLNMDVDGKAGPKVCVYV